jgi:methylmalonyl-CoA mutase N-terminal domain/subunit
MYRGRLWTMRQYAGMATADETNTRFRFLLDQGQTGLSVAFEPAHADGVGLSIIRAPKARWARPGWRSTRWRT